MKHLFLIAALFITVASFGQGRGVYGNYAPWFTITADNYTNAGVLKTLDTLTNVDTGYSKFSQAGRYVTTVDFSVTKISGTVAGTAILQGSVDGTNWFTLTGLTGVCASCQGASATITNTAGTAHYIWCLDASAPAFPNYRVRAVTTGTMSATYSTTVGSKY